MKRIISVFACICLFAAYCAAQDHLRERVYLSSDKEVYVAGDILWCSAYCVDVNTGRLSSFSGTAYVEIHSAQGLAQTGKIALYGGRGAGRIDLSNSLPTGNYRIFAYTAQSCNEIGYDYLAAAKTVSIFNPLTNDRVGNGVKIVSEEEYASRNFFYHRSEGNVRVAAVPDYTGGSASVSISNDGSEAVTLDLSVYHNDGIVPPRNPGVSDFLSGVRSLPAAAGFRNVRVPEYEGEIIRAKVSGTDAEGRDAVAYRHVFISAPDSRPEPYSADIDSNGEVSIYTSNIFGNKEMFLEIENPGEGTVCHLEIESPFVAPYASSGIPPLEMCPSLSGKLEARSMSMQISKAFESDTLYEHLPMKSPYLFSDAAVRYDLDDYTRFPLMEETIIEFITELRVGRSGNRRNIQVLMKDSYNGVYFSEGVSLVLVDGVPVFDQEKILSYDPMSVKYIDIYPYTYFIGKRIFSGVVNLVTYKGNLPGMKFEDNVRIVNFQGAAYPQAYTGEGISDDYPDYRRTILWHPLVTVAPGETVLLKCKTPAYGGRFEVVVEGMTGSCLPVYSHTFMELGPR